MKKPKQKILPDQPTITQLQRKHKLTYEGAKKMKEKLDRNSL